MATRNIFFVVLGNKQAGNFFPACLFLKTLDTTIVAA
jgi:hypothetical protein